MTLHTLRILITLFFTTLLIALLLAIPAQSAAQANKTAEKGVLLTTISVPDATIEFMDVQWPYVLNPNRVVKVCIEGTAYWMQNTTINSRNVQTMTPALKNGQPQVCELKKK